MTGLLKDVWTLTRRLLANSLRMPFFILMTVFQPLLWLLLFGELFSGLMQGSHPGFHSYAGFLAPGVAVMSAFYGSMYAGFSVTHDLNASMIDVFRTAPIQRKAIPLSYVLHNVAVVVAQVLMVLGVAALFGKLGDATLMGLAGALAICGLIGVAFGSLSVGIAFLSGDYKTLLTAANLLALPMLFLSNMLAAPASMPPWMQTAAHFNPLNWTITLAREAVSGQLSAIAILYASLFSVFTLASLWLCGWCYRRYEASL